MTTALKTEARLERSPATSEYDYRELHLRGTWHTPAGCEFKLDAVIRVESNGRADGPIDWTAVRLRGQPKSYRSTERVAGTITGRHVELDGYQAGPGLATDSYMIHLAGDDEAGAFHGMSRAYGDWCGRMQGTYRYVNRKS